MPRVLQAGHPQSLQQALGTQVIAIAAFYQHQLEPYALGAHVCAVDILHDTRLSLYCPRGHALQVGDLLTLHLDNRTGVDEYDADLSVYRLSYKARVAQVHSVHHLEVEAREFSMVYGNEVVLAYQAPDYQYPPDQRPALVLPNTPMTHLAALNPDEQDNKIGVLVTGAQKQPHTSVMAFLSTQADDVFLISHPQSFKIQLLARDQRCLFAIDERASFTFSRVLDWNYELLAMQAYQVPKTHPAYLEIQHAFIDKNPWEAGFFLDPQVSMYHLKYVETLCSGEASQHL
ncbi:hypothetical protein SAMN05421831_104127 [Allopseudospirillum japonicum]|uniref:Uncharacterized protein n=1 Tax=Allopseudospirillum japonicum TaxID=64971 RepID=A0A1H6RT44_9GAMM|nr:hypothetical protein [Allopseudospirillum japonicum]SEI56634.1 hypothetical protein SAMN05421831_104127 [Allopseudospirillum japonicum]